MNNIVPKSKRPKNFLRTAVAPAIAILTAFLNVTCAYADSAYVNQHCPAEVHGDCSHSDAQYHFYSTGNTYTSEFSRPDFEPEQYVEGMLYNSDPDSDGVFFGEEKAIFSEDSNNFFTTGFFKNGYDEGWYYMDNNMLCPCTIIHEHSWSYTADGAKLIADCNGKGECPFADTVTELTLMVSSPNYSGHTATVTIGTNDEQAAWQNAGLTLPTSICYETADGSALDSAPTLAGSYTARVTVEDASACISFEISKYASAEDEQKDKDKEREKDKDKEKDKRKDNKKADSASDKSTPSTNNTSAAKTAITPGPAPQTADFLNPGSWLMLMLISGFGLLALTLLRKNSDR